MIHQILRILLCKIFYCFQHVLLPLLVLVMGLSTECPCGVAVLSAEQALRAGLSCCGEGEQDVTWRHAAPNSGPFLCNARGVAVSCGTQ